MRCPAGSPTTAWRADLRAATGDALGVAAGMFLLGTSFGLLVVGSGLAWWWAPVFSGVEFAGSAEFLLVSLAVAGTPLLAIALITLLVNGRHVFYGLSFPLDRIRGRAGKAYAVFALIDEEALLSMAAGTLTYGLFLALGAV